MHIDQGPITLNNEEWSWGIFGRDNVSRLKKAELLVNKLMPYIENNAPYSTLPKTYEVFLKKMFDCLLMEI